MTHTSKLIIGSLSQTLKGKKIALGVTGSVAAVECVAISRLLMRHGADVYAVMSPMAHKIIHPYLLEWATGNPVIVELTGKIEHVDLAGKHDERVDLLLIAPATANTIGKIAQGIDDTAVTTTASSAIGAGIPVLIVPAMHESLYDHPAVLENIEKLREIGVHVMNPRMQEAKAKIVSPKEIVEKAISLLSPMDLVGKHFVLTAGPTRGWIDRVRFITNPSSGRMGIEIAREIIFRGGTVDLVIGPTSLEPPSEATVTSVETPKEMRDGVMTALDKSETTAFLSVAAVLDYMPPTKEETKISSGKEKLTVTLEATPKIIAEVRSSYKDLFIVGFKVESEVSDQELKKRAKEKIDSGICDLVVANDAFRKGVAFGTDTNEVLIVGVEGVVKKVPLSSKRDVAREIIDVVMQRMK
ncbi:MAG: bifunctional phosphopantothenoylcysteine decarboxylase/phosphopantothenate--cysteine ligase CoaBC [Candidatus Thorarchaeota archaeon]|jgi:phosphopantothenoylcysteine decarboxylase/phosphopantothenate--cysteine ligase